jgi:hydrogenase maturation protease
VSDRDVLVVGIGNELRGDDGIGLDVARRLRESGARAGIDVQELHGGTIELLDAWRHADAVVVVDAMRSGLPAGTVRRLDATAQPLPARLAPSSTHALALDQAIELGRALARLPTRLVVFAVEGRTFDTGAGLSAELAAIAPALAEAVLREAIALATRDPRPLAVPCP